MEEFQLLGGLTESIIERNTCVYMFFNESCDWNFDKRIQWNFKASQCP